MAEHECIYCPKSYSGEPSEHVFPKFLGGGGKSAYLACVCPECNNKFSAIERSLARDSVEAFYRNTHGPTGYKRGAGAALALRATGSYFSPPGDELLYEAGISSGFRQFFRAQFIESADGKQLLGTASFKLHMRRLVSEVRKYFKEDLHITVGERAPDKTFAVARIVPADGGFSLSPPEKQKRPKGAFLRAFEGSTGGRRTTPRIFLDDDGHLCIRANSAEEAARLLHSVEKGFKSGFAPSREIAKAVKEKGVGGHLLLRHRLKIVNGQRAIAKIAMNFVAHVYGCEFARNSAFDPVKAVILGALHNNMNEIGLHVQMRPAKGPLQVAGIPEETDMHWLLLGYGLDKRLICSLRLYGKNDYVVLLAADCPPPPTGAEKIVIASVDYKKRELRLLETDEMLSMFMQATL